MSRGDEILAQMLAAVPDSYQKTIGYPTYDWLAGAAIPTAQVSLDLEEAKRKLDPANLRGEELDRYIVPRTGLERTAATFAQGEVTVTGTGTVPAGTLFESHGGIQYAATAQVEAAGTAKVPVQCVTPGAAGNLPARAVTLMPVQVAGIVSAVNEAPMSEGYEAETDAAYYARFLARLRTPPTSGNQYHYLSWAMEVPGVGGVQVYPLDRGPNTVGVVLIDQFGKPASRELVEQVQTHIDPGSRGLGEGAAPIGAKCYAAAAGEVKLNLSMQVTKSEETAQETVTQAIRERVGAYLTEIALEAYRPVLASDHAYEASFARIGAAILEAAGVEDYTGLTVNGGTVNVKAASKQAAVLGEVVVRYAP